MMDVVKGLDRCEKTSENNNVSNSDMFSSQAERRARTETCNRCTMYPSWQTYHTGDSKTSQDNVHCPPELFNDQTIHKSNRLQQLHKYLKI